ncbi:DUF1183-domain-containing protein [Ramaria rubella]|nr:DUF1183-domain-containing protein [Ramaria rubella]
MSRVALDSISSLTFYSDTLTQSRRTPPISQLKCIGKPCYLFQPDVVRCVNDGGRGADVEWKCQADLPDSLRFGRVEVSCEGWSRPGDPMVLKGSCALEYRLVRIPKSLQNDDSYFPGTITVKTILMVLWSLFLLFVLYQLFKSCFTRPRNTGTPVPRTTPRPSGGGGWFPGHYPDNNDAPPPYSRNVKPSPDSTQRWTPGFWTGLGLGGIAASLWGRLREANDSPQPETWDWERTNSWWRRPTRRQAAPPATASGGWFRSEPRRTLSNYDRGEGSSNLGTMRRSTGWGGSSVR